MEAALHRSCHSAFFRKTEIVPRCHGRREYQLDQTKTAFEANQITDCLQGQSAQNTLWCNPRCMLLRNGIEIWLGLKVLSNYSQRRCHTFRYKTHQHCSRLHRHLTRTLLGFPPLVRTLCTLDRFHLHRPVRAVQLPSSYLDLGQCQPHTYWQGCSKNHPFQRCNLLQISKVLCQSLRQLPTHDDIRWPASCNQLRNHRLAENTASPRRVS